MEEIEVTEGLKGTILYAEGKSVSNKKLKWLVLVCKVEKNKNIFGEEGLRIFRYISVELNSNISLCNSTPQYFGDACFYKFFKPTKEHKTLIIKELAAHGFMYSPISNALINIRKR